MTVSCRSVSTWTRPEPPPSGPLAASESPRVPAPMPNELADLQNGIPDSLPDGIISAVSDIEAERQQKLADEAMEADRREVHTYLKRWLAECMQERRANLENKWN